MEIAILILAALSVLIGLLTWIHSTWRNRICLELDLEINPQRVRRDPDGPRVPNGINPRGFILNKGSGVGVKKAYFQFVDSKDQEITIQRRIVDELKQGNKQSFYLRRGAGKTVSRNLTGDSFLKVQKRFGGVDTDDVFMRLVVQCDNEKVFRSPTTSLKGVWKDRNPVE